MIRSKLTTLTVVGLLSISSSAAFAQSSGRDAPVDKGGMPPYSEMNAGTSGGKVLPPDTIGGGSGGDASGSSTSPGKGSGSMSDGSSMGSGSGSGSGESGDFEIDESGGGAGSGDKTGG
ncbi:MULTISPECIES: hypothetical protein [Pseudomonas]|uniref:Uncharacterized protein n=1 Tax=Pseudomonas wuhanensis TaxID=2954098 RepID=A0ABY9GX39_9PSED|nr:MULTISPECIES: hypothetical protein [unclassified Pseudomonas]WLI14449.1 hypothetical protein PSH65_10125 [Pseudomonas sp. FP603]WLI20366.1 hypothetical protein PSH88_10145 [Pseudomonas sp. FP607]